MTSSPKSIRMERILSSNSSIHLLHPPQSTNQWHGCIHLSRLRSSSPPHLAGSTTPSQPSLDLDEAYKTCVRYALSYHSRYQISKISNTETNGHMDAFRQGTKRKRNLEHGLIIIDKIQLPLPQCCDCDDVGSRLHACLQCVYLGCWKRNHMVLHLRDHKHLFAMDFSHCTVFCVECGDYVYDANFERVLNAEKTRLDSLITEAKESGGFQQKQVKQSHYSYWIPPSAEQVANMRRSARIQKCSGIRGLRNLGSSCYMSVILQALIHNPLFSAHFLSSKHSQATCGLSPCIACEMDNLFAEFYKGDTTCFAPITFMYATWLTAKHLAGNMHQDAHEFYIATLNQIHSNCSGTSEASIGDTSECKCIVHQVFSGFLSSEVTCHECGKRYTKPDEFLDLSLDLSFASRRNGVKNSASINKLGLEGVNSGIPKQSKQNGSHTVSPSCSAASTPSSSTFEDIYTLSDCLGRYTMPEKLNPNVYFCAKCNKYSDNASKQLSLLRLPPVLTIQLKRFQQHTQQSVKIETPIRIPAELDMTPFSTKVIHETYGKSSPMVTPISPSLPRQVKKYDTELDSVPAYRYVLLAIVNHEGKLETGHYTSYNKVRGMWFRFDDANVTSATQKDVLDSKAYMCFYIRSTYEFLPTSAVEIRSRASPTNRLQTFSRLTGASPPPPLVSTENGSDGKGRDQNFY